MWIETFDGTLVNPDQLSRIKIVRRNSNPPQWSVVADTTIGDEYQLTDKSNDEVDAYNYLYWLINQLEAKCPLGYSAISRYVVRAQQPPTP